MKPKKEKQKSMTVFELQEEAWLDNDCGGNIEDYSGCELPGEGPDMVRN